MPPLEMGKSIEYAVVLCFVPAVMMGVLSLSCWLLSFGCLTEVTLVSDEARNMSVNTTHALLPVLSV